MAAQFNFKTQYSVNFMCFIWKIFGKGGVLAWQSHEVGIHMKIKVLNKYFKVCMRHTNMFVSFEYSIATFYTVYL